MPVNDNALLEAVSTVARNRSVTVNLQQSAKAGMIAGGSCFVGAVLGGPVGLVAGGLVGTYIAYSRSGDIKPLYQIINEELDSTQKAQLVINLQQAFSDINAQDVMMLAAIVLSNSNVQEKAMKVAIEYVTSQCIGR